MATYTFTPPVVYDTPPILPRVDSTLQNLLFRHYAPRARGVNVFQLEDGTYVQDTPTVENRNSAVPYPIGSPDNLVNSGWNPFTLTQMETPVINPVVKTYYGGHANIVTVVEAAALTAAGYGAYIVVT